MKYKFLICALLLYTGATQVQAQQGAADKVAVTAEIKGLDAGEWIYYNNVSKTIRDSVKSNTDGFKVTIPLKLENSDFYEFHLGDNAAPSAKLSLYLEPGTVNISGDGPGFTNAKISGSEFIKENDELKAFFASKADSLRGLGLQGLEMMVPAGKLLAQWAEMHPSSRIAAAELSATSSFIDPSVLKAAVSRLTPEAKNTVEGRKLDAIIQLAVGGKAPDFTQPDTSGKPVSLHDFRGKYVLVDFWATWCVPCRAENPNVIKAYLKYKDHNFTVLGVAWERPGDQAKWLEAIKHDGLLWTQVADFKVTNAAAALYNVPAIPANFLIDPNGNIIAHNLMGDELDKKLSELLLDKKLK